MTAIEGAPVSAGTTPVRPRDPEPNVKAGVLAAIGTYGAWGILPLFFDQLETTGAVVIVANRVVFSLLVVGAILSARGRMGEVAAALRNRKAVRAMCASTVLIAINWTLFVWAVTNHRVLEVSFGYFINPLVSVAIGMVFLGERQNRVQIAAIALACIAVAIQWVTLGIVPWVALGLAFSFGFYGYVRKTAAVGSAPGLLIETLILLPVALIFLAWLLSTGQPVYTDPWTTFWLVMTGPFTAFPLLGFAFAARQLRLTTIGMFQYIAPSLQFLCAVLILGEVLTASGLVSFVLIWISLAIFSLDTWRRRGRRSARAVPH